MRMKPRVKKTEFYLAASLRLSGSIASQINCEWRCVQMTSQKRDPHRDSDKHWLFLVEVARTLYRKAEFAISSACRFSAPVSKFEESPGKYNVEQIKTLLKCKGLKQSGKLENF